MSTSSRFLIPGLLASGLLTLLLVALLTLVRPVSSATKFDPAAANAGKPIFLMVCASCHGPQALGINGLGKPLVGSAFFNSHTDAQLLAFLQVGRRVDDPLNTTGVVMPARGGRLSLTDTDLANVIAYIRSLNAAKYQPVVD